MPQISNIKGEKKTIPVRRQLTMSEIPPGMGFDNKNSTKSTEEKKTLKNNKKIDSPITQNTNDGGELL